MAISIISLNQLVKLMRDFSNANLFLNDFGFGNTSEIGTSRQMEFPYMWVTPQPSTINNLNKVTTPNYNFTIIFADRINDEINVGDNNGEESNNGLEVLSDTFQIAQDFLTYVNANWGQYGILFNLEDVTISPTIDGTDDKINGWAMDIIIKTKFVNCVLPI
tara:strand:+ start:762 stop:1247 length:486 start_codon:yes stop_codon:yes gene_type:complete